MRSPSRLILTPLVSLLVAFSMASIASSDNVDQVVSIDPAAFHPITRVAFDRADDAAAARIDERLNMALSGPTTMECSNDAESGFETCIVRTIGVSSTPAALAQN